MAVANNKVLQKAEAEYTYLTGDAAQRRLEELRIKWEIDRRSALSYAEQKGEARGKKQGNDEKAKQIAKNMLKKNMKIEEIIEITGLTKEEIENLK